MEGMNPHKAAARVAKATALVLAWEQLDREVNGKQSTAGALAYAAEKLIPPRRRALAILARVHPPSEETWALVVRVLRARDATPERVN